MKKLYLISYYFAPLGRADGINRSYLVKYLYELGWDIDVIACSNPHGFIRNFQSDPNLLDVIPSCVRLHHIRSPYWGPLGGIGSILRLLPDPFLNWYGPAVKNGMSNATSPGILCAVAPPLVNVLVANKIAERTGFPLVVDFRDNVFNVPSRIVKRGRGIVASTPFSLDELCDHYGIDPQNGHVMYNGFPEDAEIQTRSTIRTRNDLRVVYAGLLNLDQDPVIIIRAIKLLEEMYPETKGLIQVDFFGPPNYYTKLFLQRKLNNQFRFHGYLPFSDIVSKIGSSDIGFASIRGAKKSYCIPSKVYQYIAAETPVFAVGPKGALSDLVSDKDIGLFADYSDLKRQAEILHDFLSKGDLIVSMKNNLKKLKPEMSMRFQVGRLDTYLSSLV